MNTRPPPPPPNPDPHALFIAPPICMCVLFCIRPLFLNIILSILSSLAISLLRKSELSALLLLWSCCPVAIYVLCLSWCLGSSVICNCGIFWTCSVINVDDLHIKFDMYGIQESLKPARGDSQLGGHSPVAYHEYNRRCTCSTKETVVPYCREWIVSIYVKLWADIFKGER